MIAITGATGAVGGRVAHLLSDLPLRLLVRDPSRAPEIGAEVAVAEYDDRDALDRALEGIDTLFFVSAAESDHRRQEHQNVVDAAKAAGVSHVVYTSFDGASPDATFTLGRDHAATEQAIRDAGLSATMLRDNFYLDVLPLFADADGVIKGPAGDGRVAGVARADVAESAAAVLRDPAPHAGKNYVLTGGEALTMDEVAQRAGAVLGRDLRFENETLEEAYASRSAEYPGTPQYVLDAWVSTYTAIGSNVLSGISPDVQQLTGHAPRTLEQTLAG